MFLPGPPGCVSPSAKTVGAGTLGCRLESLRRKTSYSVQVMASTSAGGFNGTRITFQTLSVSECPAARPPFSGPDRCPWAGGCRERAWARRGGRWANRAEFRDRPSAPSCWAAPNRREEAVPVPAKFTLSPEPAVTQGRPSGSEVTASGEMEVERAHWHSLWSFLSKKAHPTFHVPAFTLEMGSKKT